MAKQLTKTQKSSIGGIAGILIAGVIAVEGGYVFHENDPGGETNMGITKQVAVENNYTGPMRTIPREVVEGIYYKKYLVQPGFDKLIPIDAAVTEELFDTTVNMGPARPSGWFQEGTNKICNTKLVVDRKVGPGTVNAYKKCQVTYGATKLCITMLDYLDTRQRAEYTRLVGRNPKLGVFYKGWINHRVGNVDRAKCKVTYANTAA